MKPSKLSNKQLLHAHGAACRKDGHDSPAAKRLQREIDRRRHAQWAREQRT